MCVWYKDVPFLYMYQLAIYFLQGSGWTAWQAQSDRPNVIPLAFFQQIEVIIVSHVNSSNNAQAVYIVSKIYIWTVRLRQGHFFHPAGMGWKEIQCDFPFQQNTHRAAEGIHGRGKKKHCRRKRDLMIEGGKENTGRYRK